MKQYNRTKAKYIQISRSYEEHINSVLFYSHVNILHGVCLPTHLSCVGRNIILDSVYLLQNNLSVSVYTQEFQILSIKS